MSVFNPDRFFKGQTIFSSKNFGPGDQNFQDQNSKLEEQRFLSGAY